MLSEYITSMPVYIVTGYTDMRKSIDGLATIIQGQLSLDPYSKNLFLFCGRKCDRLKALLWEGNGFALLYKRLDNGRYHWPRNQMQARKLSSQQIRWLLEGLEIEQPRAIREGKHGDIY